MRVEADEFYDDENTISEPIIVTDDSTLHARKPSDADTHADAFEEKISCPPSMDTRIQNLKLKKRKTLIGIPGSC